MNYNLQARGEAGWAKGASRGRGRGRGDYGRQNFQSVFGGGGGQHSNVLHPVTYCSAIISLSLELLHHSLCNFVSNPSRSTVDHVTILATFCMLLLLAEMQSFHLHVPQMRSRHLHAGHSR